MQGTQQPNTAAARYFGLVGGNKAAQSAEDTSHQPIPISGTIMSFRVWLATAPGAGKSWTVKIRKNGADSGISVVISDTATTGADLVNTVTVSPGDKIDVQVTPSGTPTASNIAWSCVIDAASKTSCFLGGDLTPSATTTTYWCPQGCFSSNSADTGRRAKITTPGVIKNLYVQLNAVAPGAGKSYTYTIMKNGVATALQVVISDTATSGSNTTSSVTVAAGDNISMRITPSGTPAVPWSNWGVEFDPDNDGESLILNVNVSNPSSTATHYLTIGGNWTSRTTEGNFVGVAPMDFVIKNFYVEISIGPGAGKSYQYALRKNSVTQSLSVTLTGTSPQTQSDLVNTVNAAQGDIVNFIIIPSGTPGSIAPVSWGATAYIPPTSGAAVLGRREMRSVERGVLR